MTQHPERDDAAPAASQPADPGRSDADTAPAPESDPRATDAPDDADGAHPPHPPFARSPDDYTDPPGHHRRGPHGPALDVGA